MWSATTWAIPSRSCSVPPSDKRWQHRTSAAVAAALEALYLRKLAPHPVRRATAGYLAGEDQSMIPNNIYDRKRPRVTDSVCKVQFVHLDASVVFFLTAWTDPSYTPDQLGPLPTVTEAMVGLGGKATAAQRGAAFFRIPFHL